MKKIIGSAIISILLFLFSPNSYGQNVIPTKGKDFWMCFMENYHGVNQQPVVINVFVSSDVNTSGTISIPAQGYSQSFSVVANVTTTITIPTNLVEHMTSDAIENKGVHLVTNDIVSAYAFNIEDYSADGSNVLPIDALGTNYRISAAYKAILGSYSEIAIVATADNTEIIVTPSVTTMNGHTANVPFTIYLNQGESYQIQASNSNDNLVGTTLVGTDKSGECRPFAVFSGSQCTDIPSSCTACDHIFEQEFPVKTWGSSFMLVPFSYATTYTYSVTAAQNNTVVTENGIVVATLNVGNVFEKNSITSTLCVTTSYPASVVQFMEGQSCAGAGDPSNLMINSNDQKIDNVTFSTVQSNIITQHYVNVIIATPYIGQVLLDNATVSASSFKSFTSCAGYSYAQIPLIAGSHTLAADSGFIAYVYGAGGYESYAYSVGSYSRKSISPVDTAYCSTAAVKLNPPVILYNAWWANATLPTDTIAKGLTLNVHPTSSQIYIVNGNSIISGCPASYKFAVEIPTPPNLKITKTKDSLCVYQPIQLQTILTPASSSLLYLWTPDVEISNNSIPNPIVTPSVSRWYYCKVYSATGCSSALDSIYVKVVNGNLSQMGVTTSNTKICNGESSQLNTNLQRILQSDNFDSGTNTNLWSAISLGTSSNACGSVAGNALYFNGTGTRSATTKDFNLLNGGTIQFNLKLASGTAFPCDNIEPGKDIILEYSTDAGSTWVNVNTYYANSFPTFKTVSVTVPAAAQTSATRFRWRQLNNGGNNQDNWAIDEVSISSSSTSSFSFKWTPSTGLTSSSIANPIASPTKTTTYKVVINDLLTGCIYQDSVTINVGQSFTLSKTKDTVLCSTNGIGINVVPSPAGTYKYSWTPLGTLSSATISNPVVTPTSTTKYYIKVISANGCVKTDSIKVTVNSLSTFLASPHSDSLCVGQTHQLKTSIQSACGANNSTCSGASSTIQAGNGTYTSYSDDVNPYSYSSLSTKRQILITKAELNALGLTQGSTIQQLGFNMISGGGYSYQNFTIKMACTSLASMNSNFVTSGMQTVFNPKTITTANGINYYTFDNSYDWDGVSNLLVEVCFSNTSYASYSYVAYTYTASNTVTYTTGLAVCDATTGYSSYYRPNIYLKACSTKPASLSYQWSPSTGLSSSTISNPFASPATSTTYKVTAKDAVSGCKFVDSVKVLVGANFTLSAHDTTLCSTMGINLNVTPSAAGTYTYAWTPRTFLSNPGIKNPLATPFQTTKFM